MDENRRELKAQARVLLRETKPGPLWVTLVFFLLTGFITWLSDRISGGGFVLLDVDAYMRTGVLEDAIYYNFLYIPAFGWTLLLAFEVIGIVLSAGFTIYTLRVSRRLPCGYGNLFDGFGLFFRVFCLYLLQGLLIFLWTLLLVVPGIIAMYKYRMALYLLLDHPEWSVSDCLRQSKLMMRGHKLELFVLDLSFLGWYLLCIFPPMIIFAAPFHNVTDALFYNRLADAPPAGSQSGAWGGQGGDPGQKPPWEY